MDKETALFTGDGPLLRRSHVNICLDNGSGIKNTVKCRAVRYLKTIEVHDIAILVLDSRPSGLPQ